MKYQSLQVKGIKGLKPGQEVELVIDAVVKEDEVKTEEMDEVDEMIDKEKKHRLMPMSKIYQ